MSRIAALFLAALLLAGLPACTEPAAPPAADPTPQITSAPADERETFALGYDPSASLHPITGDSRINLELAGLVYEGLFALNNSFDPIPLLARSAQPDESGLVWTVSIREDAVFSDGSPLTPAHVVSSLQSARRSSLYAARLKDVTSVKEKNGAVVITLSVPNGALPALLDIPVVLEQENGIPLGTGPYRFVISGGQMALMINGSRPDWESLPYQNIPLREIDHPDRLITAFDSGSISAVSADPTASCTLGYSCSSEPWSFPTTDLLYIGFQTGEDSPCSSPELRRACSMAFDRQGLSAELMEGLGDPASLPLSPLHPDYDRTAADLLDYDPGQAAELLAQAGFRLKEDGLLYSGRQPVELTLAVNRDSRFKLDAADALAADLAQLGLTVTVERLNWEDYLRVLEDGSFDLYLGEVRLTGDFDMTELLLGGLNYGGWSSEEAPALLAEWKSASHDARTAAAAPLWELLAAEAPIAPLCFKQNLLLVRWGMLAGLSPTRGNLFYGISGWQPLE